MNRPAGTLAFLLVLAPAPLGLVVAPALALPGQVVTDPPSSKTSTPGAVPASAGSPGRGAPEPPEVPPALDNVPLAAGRTKASTSPSAVPADKALVAAGWRPLPAGERTRTSACTLLVPEVPKGDAVRAWVSHPAGFPRPRVSCDASDGPQLPLALDASLMARIGSVTSWRQTLMTWNVHVDARQVGPTAWVATLDVPPFKAAPTTPPAEGVVELPSPAVSEPMGAPPPQGLGRGLPASVGQSFRALMARQGTANRMPAIAITPAADVKEDAFLATPDDGDTWWHVKLAGPTGFHHPLALADLAGVQTDGGPALLISPRPSQPQARLGCLLVRRGAAASDVPRVDELGNPGPAQGGWRQRVTDARTTADGTLQVVVLVHETPIRERADPPDAEWTASWGVVAARSPAPGAGWTELTRFPLPDGVVEPVVRMSPGPDASLTLTVGDVPVATR